MYCKQVKFKDDDGVELGGILIEDDGVKGIICGCCGGYYDLTDPDEAGEITITTYGFWNDISNEIMGN